MMSTDLFCTPVFSILSSDVVYNLVSIKLFSGVVWLPALTTVL